MVEEYAGWDCDQTSWIGVDRKGRTVLLVQRVCEAVLRRGVGEDSKTGVRV